jgi:hypothetical protein
MIASGNSHTTIELNPSHKILNGYYRARYTYCPRPFNYCYNLKCKRSECRERGRWIANIRMKLGIAVMQQRSDTMWFLTISERDLSRLTHTIQQIENLKKRINQVSKKLGDWAKYRKHDLMWVRAYGLKQGKTHQLHVHMLVSWLPDPNHIQGYRYTSRKLQQLADKLDLDIHIKQVYDPIGVARYMSYKNLIELDAIDLPPYFSRIRFSNNYPKTPFQQRRYLKTKIKKHWAWFCEHVPMAVFQTMGKLLGFAVLYYECLPKKPLNRIRQPYRSHWLDDGWLVMYRWWILVVQGLLGKIRHELWWYIMQIYADN